MPTTITKSEAWADMAPVLQTPGGNLNVILDISGLTSRAHLVKKMPQGINPKIILLNIKLTDEPLPFVDPQHLSFAEALSSIGQYTEISILHNGQIIDQIKEIPLVY